MRDHLQQVAKITGKTPEALIEPELAPGCDAIWQIFSALDRGREKYDKPFTWRDLHDWQELFGVQLDSFEIDTLMRMDRAALAARDGAN